MARMAKYALPQFYGVVGVLDGKDIGAGAIVWGDGRRPYLCMEITDTLRAHPIFMHRVAKSLIKAALAVCGELYTIESADEPTAQRWLQQLGFVPTGEFINGERLLTWQKSLQSSAPSEASSPLA
jgi:hypothetical protein